MNAPQKSRNGRIVRLIASVLVLFSDSVYGQSIQGIGVPYPGAMSYDGNVIIGQGPLSEGYPLLRWSEGNGVQTVVEGNMGDNDGAGVSGDGRVVVSMLQDEDNLWGSAFKWQNGTRTLLDGINAAGAASYDGSFIVGTVHNEETGDWDVVTSTGANFGRGRVHDVDSSGTVFVGYSYQNETSRATVWPSGIDLGEGDAWAVSPDGRVVVGHLRINGSLSAFRWSAESGTKILGPGSALDLTRNGDVVVGMGPGGPFVWTEVADSIRSLESFVTSHGFELGGWQLLTINGISVDGSVLFGAGIDPGGEPKTWRVELCATTVSWSSENGGSWGDADNRSTGTLPGEHNDAVFVASGSYSVSMNEDFLNNAFWIFDDVDLTLNGGSSTYTLTGECGPASIGMEGGFLEVPSGTLAAEREVLLFGHEPVLSVGAEGRLVVDSDDDGTGCLIADGDDGTEALLSLADGASVESKSCTTIGKSPDTKGRLELDREARLTTDKLVVGEFGEGAVGIPGQDGYVGVRELHVGVESSSSGTIEVADVSVLAFDETALIGIRGKGSLLLTDDGVAGGGDPPPEGVSLLVLGRESGGDGSLRIEGHSSFANSDAVVGMNGLGSIYIRDGGVATIRRVWIGGHLEATSGQGVVGVEGAESVLETRYIWIGRGNLGILSATEGGMVRANKITVYGSGFARGEGGKIEAPILVVGEAPVAPKRGDLEESSRIVTDTLILMGEDQALNVETLVLGPGGVIGGDGTFPRALTNTGIISPGDSAGTAATFRVDEGYTQDAGGILEIELGGTAEGEFDRLVVAGPATLGGTLRLLTREGYLPDEGDRFEILVAESVSGTFAAIDPPWAVPVEVIYDDRSVVAVVLAGVNTENAPDEGPTREVTLGQNYPNPFGGSTEIAFTLPERAHVRLVVYDILGREVISLVDRDLPAGSHEVTLHRGTLPPGQYFYRMESGGKVLTRVATVMR